jgi:hypothetical protein
MRIKCEKEFILYIDFFTSKMQFYINPWIRIRNQIWKMDPDPVPATQMMWFLANLYQDPLHWLELLQDRKLIHIVQKIIYECCNIGNTQYVESTFKQGDCIYKLTYIRRE